MTHFSKGGILNRELKNTIRKGDFIMKIKKISALVLSLMLVFAMSISAFAASKDDIISKLQSAGVATEYVNVAKQFLADNTVSSDADAAYVIAKIDAATATANGVKDIASLTADQKSAIMADIKDAAAKLGATVSFDASNNTITAVKDGKSYVVALSAKVVKDTGFTTAATVGVVAVLAMGLVVCAFVSKKKVA